MLSYSHSKTGNLLSQRGILVHNSNVQGVMGSRLNLDIIRCWPQVEQVYKKAWKRNELWLGHVIFVQIDNDLVLANCITREFESDTKIYVNYEAVQMAYNRVAHYAKLNHMKVHYTNVGNKNTNWNVIKKTIDNELDTVDHTLWTLADCDR